MITGNQPQPSVTIGLVNPKNVSNVGASVRAAHCFGADRIFYTGTRYQRAARFHTDTKNAAASLPLHHTESLLEALDPDCHIICIELALGATPLNEFEHPTNAAYVFGPEDGTLSQSLINEADSVVFIPANSSLNLAAAVNVVLYDRQAKQQATMTRTDIDNRVRHSRDCRNRLKVRHTEGTTTNTYTISE
jgi:tRNA(Leu) C34 or U34 (ribose-2'-O)-methylase TrmL